MKVRYRLAAWSKRLSMRSERTTSAEYKGQSLKTVVQITSKTKLEEKLQLRKILLSCPSHQILEQDFLQSAQRTNNIFFIDAGRKE